MVKITNKTKQKILQLLFTGLLIVSLIIIIVSSIVLSHNDKTINFDNPSSFNENWYLDKDKSAFSLPYTNKNNTTIKISNVLPDDLPAGTAILIETNYQIVNIYLDDNLVYEYNENIKVFGKTIALAKHYISLDSAQDGQKITIETSVLKSRDIISIKNISLGTASTIILNTIRHNISSLLLCCFMLMLTIVFSVVTIALTRKQNIFEITSFIYLTIFSLATAVWIYTDSDIPLLFSAKPLTYVVSYLAFMIMVISYILFIRQSCKFGKKLLTIIYILLVVNFFMAIILALTGAMTFTDTLIITHILLILSIVAVVYISLKSFYTYKKSDILEILIGTSILGVCAIINIVIHYLSISGFNYQNNSMVFKFGLVIFVILLATGAYRKSIRIIKNQFEAEAYKKMALTDILTDLGNRTFFERVVEIYEHTPESFTTITVINFDVDDLKYINDTYGHSVGDEILRGCAECIKSTFSDSQCARIGGDEFAVIVVDKNDEEILSILTKFDQAVDNYNLMHTNKLNVSWGYSSDDAQFNQHETMRKLLRVADEKMYNQKIIKKVNRK